MIAPPAVVDTSHGAVRGVRMATGVTAFLGIPYAAEPLGERRFRPPTDSAGWRGIRDATSYPPAPQQDRSPVFGSGLGDPSAPATDCSEDCLYLNVWIPPGRETKPVIVWLFGGGFDIGGAAPPFTDGAALARGTGAVVVAANYRLGAFGFLHLADLGGADWAGCTNVGLQDQVAALRWVRTNMGAFGGDPANVTVAEQSAGAYSIGALLGMPTAAGCFDKAILHSGTTRAVDAATATAMTTDLLTALHLDDLTGLLSVPAAQIASAQSEVIDADIGRRHRLGGRSWGPVVDAAVLPTHPREAITAGVAASIPLLIGANRDEVRLFEVLQGTDPASAGVESLHTEMRAHGVANPPALTAAYQHRLRHDGRSGVTSMRTVFLTDALYRVAATRMASAQTDAGGSAYQYLFSAEPFGPHLGAFHGAELSYVFDKLAEAGIDTDEQRIVRSHLMTAWSRFAHAGSPGWAAHRGTPSDTVRQFGATADYCLEPPLDLAGTTWRTAPLTAR